MNGIQQKNKTNKRNEQHIYLSYEQHIIFHLKTNFVLLLAIETNSGLQLYLIYADELGQK